MQFNEALLLYILFVYLFNCKAVRSSVDLSSPGSISKAFLILYSFKNHTQLNMKSIKEIEIIFSIFNFGTLALPYLTYLARPYDLELFSQNLVTKVPDFEAVSLRGWSCSRFVMGCNQGQTLLCEDNVLQFDIGVLRVVLENGST